MMVSFCTCERLAFRDILAWANEHGTTSFDEVQQGIKVGKRCGMCCCYIEYALATGQSEVPYPCPPLPPAKAAQCAGCN